MLLLQHFIYLFLNWVLHGRGCLYSILTNLFQVLFDEFGVIRKYESVYDIIKVYQKVRLQKYQERRVFLLGMLEAECSKLENQARFILEKIEGKVVIGNDYQHFISACNYKHFQLEKYGKSLWGSRRTYSVKIICMNKWWEEMVGGYIIFLKRGA